MTLEHRTQIKGDRPLTSLLGLSEGVEASKMIMGEPRLAQMTDAGLLLSPEVREAPEDGMGSLGYRSQCYCRSFFVLVLTLKPSGGPGCRAPVGRERRSRGTLVPRGCAVGTWVLPMWIA